MNCDYIWRTERGAFGTKLVCFEVLQREAPGIPLRLGERVGIVETLANGTSVLAGVLVDGVPSVWFPMSRRLDAQAWVCEQWEAHWPVECDPRQLEFAQMCAGADGEARGTAPARSA